MQNAGQFNNTKQTAENVVTLSAPKLALRRITFNSADGTQLDKDKTWRFKLSAPVYNVVYIDWSLISNIAATCLLRIDEIPSNGITSSGQGYFAALVGGSTQNILIQAQPSVKFQPISISQVTFTLFPASQSFSQTLPWSIELYFYVED